MEASELRIGNYVLHQKWDKHENQIKSEKVIKVYDFNNEGVNLSIETEYTSDDYSIHCECYFKEDEQYTAIVDLVKPIPLTGEWFDKDKFDFEKTGLKYHIGELEEMPFIIDDESGLYYYNMVSPEIQIKFVHSLQNLYHAIRSEELTIKETE